jgi:DNA-binding transcriptional MerR regulator
MWAINQVARMSGVTSRTLRHYDAIGLVVPTAVGAGGRRLYDREALERLQQVLLLRQLGVDLTSIGEALAAGTDDVGRLELLRRHHERLVTERARLDRLASTVRATVESIEKGNEMAAKDLFAGFDHTEHEDEARRRWGDDAVTSGNATWQNLGNDGQAGFQREMQDVTQGLAAAMTAGADPDDDGPQRLVERHHALISIFWLPDAQSFAALGQMYVDDARFRATYDEVAPGLAAYVRDAMAAFAAARLADGSSTARADDGT